MFRKLISALAIAAIAIPPSKAAKFFDTSAPESLFEVGVRLGVNTSNRSLDKNIFDVWNINAWGAGVNIGAVADINFRDYISIQPGIFFESRASKYTYVNTESVTETGPLTLTQYGKDRSYNFTIPILCSVHFNVSNDIRWNVEAGPYFQIIMKNKVNGSFSYPLYRAENAIPAGYTAANASNFDFGFKFGSSLKFKSHYLVGIHYEAGCLHPWKEKALGGSNKAWVFSLGYDF